jgi:hypothetical protein
MSSKISPKLEERVIPSPSGFSPWLDLGELRPVAIQTPPQWDTANITVRARMRTTGTGAQVWNDDQTSPAAIIIPAGPDRFIRLTDDKRFLGAASIAFAADGQTAPRTIAILLLPADLIGGGSGKGQ